MRPTADGYRVTVGRIKKKITDLTSLKDGNYEDQDIAAVNGVIPIPGDVAFLKAPEEIFNIIIKLNSVNTIVALNAYLRWHYSVYLSTVRLGSDYRQSRQGLLDTLTRRGIDNIPFAGGEQFRISAQFERYADARPLWLAVFNVVNKNRLFVPFLREQKLNRYEMTYNDAGVEAISEIVAGRTKTNREIDVLTRTIEAQVEAGVDINWNDEIGKLDPLIALSRVLDWKLERVLKETSMSSIANGHVANLTVESVARTWVYDGVVTRASPNVNGTGKKHPEDYQSIDMGILQQGRAPIYILSSDVSNSFYAEAVQVENGPVSVVFRGPAKSVPDRAYRDALYIGFDEREANQIRNEVLDRMSGEYPAPDVAQSRPHDRPTYVRGPALPDLIGMLRDLVREQNRINLKVLFSEMQNVEEVVHGAVRSMDCVVKQCLGAPGPTTKRRTTPFGKYAGGLFCGETHAEGSQTELKLDVPGGGNIDADTTRPLRFIEALEKTMQPSRFPYWRLQPDKGYSAFCKEWFEVLSFGTTRPLNEFLNWDEVKKYAQIPLKKDVFFLLRNYVVGKVFGREEEEEGEGEFNVLAAMGEFIPVPVFEQGDLPTSEEWARFPLIKKIVEKYKKKLVSRRDSKAADLLRALGNPNLPIDQLLVGNIQRNVSLLATIDDGNTVRRNKNHVDEARIRSIRQYVDAVRHRLGYLDDLGDLGDLGNKAQMLVTEYRQWGEMHQAIVLGGEAVPPPGDPVQMEAYIALLRSWLVFDEESKHYDRLIPVQIYRQVREMVRNSVRTAPLNRGHPICTILSTPRTLARREVRHLELQGVRRKKARLANGQTEKNWMATELAAKRVHIPTIPQMSYARGRFVRPTEY